MPPADITERLAETAAAIDRVLDLVLSTRPAPGERARPEHLLGAMRYAALGAGKRLRPFLLIESARLFGPVGEGTLKAAAALECMHCYSLVHDDLPAMDDDDMRRGKPTVHKAYDEATAILAGDALQTLAFELLAEEAVDRDPGVRTALVAGLARASGLAGMAGGQMLDLVAERVALADVDVALMQAMKTGALIAYACEAGAVIGRAAAEDRARLAAFGARLGLAFQLADDLIDATGTAAAAGKATAKDAARGKATLVARHGVATARAMLADAVGEAVAMLAPFGPRGDVLAAAAHFVAERDA